jgi:hypothetical protein
MMRIRAIARLRHTDDGISMAELLVYCLLLGGVMTLVGSLLINSLRTEDTVSGVIDASTAAQLTASSVETGIRNSSVFKLETVNGSDQLLRARVVDNTGVWTCTAWYYSNSENTVRFKQDTGALTAPGWSSSALANWTLLASNVEPAAGAAATAPIFSQTTSQLTLNFRVLAGDNPPATIKTSAIRRITQGSTQCWT